MNDNMVLQLKSINNSFNSDLNINCESEGTFSNKHNSDNLFRQYREVLFKTLITTFGLDTVLFTDINGGNVQTLHNAENKIYANELFRERGEREYDRDDYAPAGYMNARRKREFQTKDIIIDGYTGKELPKDGRTHLEHIKSAKENHDDTATRIFFSKEEMAELINDETNTTYIEGRMNQSKSDSSYKEWSQKTSKKDPDKTNTEYFGVDEKKASKADSRARAVIDEKIARRKMEYYSQAMISDSISQGKRMAARQALGVVLTEVVCTIMDEIPIIIKKFKNFSIEEFAVELATLVKDVFARVGKKKKEILEAISSGFFAGIFTSISTTIINLVFSTGKSIVRIIRQSMVSITEAIKVLFFSKKDLSAGERCKAALKILLTGASAVLGVLVNEAVMKLLQSTGAATLPYIGGVLQEIVPVFVGALTTGLLTVTFLYFIDNSEIIESLVTYINKITTDIYDSAVKTFEEANKELDKLIAKLISIDIEHIQIMAKELEKINKALSSQDVDDTTYIYNFLKKNHIDLPYHNFEEYRLNFLDESSAFILG